MIEPSKNSPNPEKFLKEMRELRPFLEAKKVIQKEDHRDKLVNLNGHEFHKVSRKQARGAGFKNAREANQAINSNKYAQMEHERRANAIGFTVEENFRKRHPFITKLANLTGWIWLYKLVFLSWNVKGGTDEVEGVPGIECSWVNIYRFGKTIEIIRLVWEEHNKKRMVK